MLDGIFDSALTESIVRALIPILLAALGGMLCERAGVFQISMEGLMLIGAFSAVSGSFYSGSALVGVLVAMAAGTLVSLLLAYGAVSRGGDAIILGIAINLFAVGITGFLLPQLFGVRGVFRDPQIIGLSTYPLPGLSEIPVVGGALFDLSIPGYIGLLMVPALWVFLFRSAIGTRLRGVGERPTAAATMGVSPVKYQYGTVAFSGAMAGLAGAQLALGNVVQFAEGMSAGRGWIAVVAVMLGRAHPVGVLLAAVLFGLSEAIGFRLQGNGMSSQITDSFPYLATLITLVLARKRFASALNLTSNQAEVHT